MRKLLIVVAVALLDGEGRVLLAQRPEGKSLAGLWEFPGGKREANESLTAALVRELHEELGINVAEKSLSPWQFASHVYPDFDLLMPVFTCTQWEGTPEGKEAQNLAWVGADTLSSYPMPPADIPLIAPLAELLGKTRLC
jgi:8-oxo-dGTP diphosphatase